MRLKNIIAIVGIMFAFSGCGFLGWAFENNGTTKTCEVTDWANIYTENATSQELSFSMCAETRPLSDNYHSNHLESGQLQYYQPRFVIESYTAEVPDAGADCSRASNYKSGGEFMGPLHIFLSPDDLMNFKVCYAEETTFPGMLDFDITASKLLIIDRAENCPADFIEHSQDPSVCYNRD